MPTCTPTTEQLIRYLHIEISRLETLRSELMDRLAHANDTDTAAMVSVRQMLVNAAIAAATDSLATLKRQQEDSNG
jgi:hypothetical protein